MKVKKIETFVVKNEPIHRFENDPPKYVGGRYLLFVLVETSDGIIGLGERPTGGVIPNSEDLKSHVEIIHEISRKYLIGQNPFNIESFWLEAFAERHDLRHPSLYSTPAISALEIACWDIIGKATNQPIYNLLGGQYHETLRSYAYMPSPSVGFSENPELAGEIALQLVESGNSACKIDPFPPGFPSPRNVSLSEINAARRIFESIRNAVGDKLEVGIGTHGQMTTYSAIRVAKALEEYSPLWFEEPVHPENVSEMARIASHTSIPIATGERLATKFEFSEVLKQQAAQIIQLDVGQCGGILESKKIAGIAETHYALIAPHMYCGPIAASAAIQLDTCTPNFLIQEANQSPLHERIFTEPLGFKDGHIVPSSKPGLGIELNMEELKTRVVDHQISN